MAHLRVANPYYPQFVIVFSANDKFPGNTLTPQDTGISVQLTNLNLLPMRLDSVQPADLFALTGSNGYEVRQNYYSSEQQTWQKSYTVPSDKTTPVKLPLNPDGTGLEPGFYMLHVDLDSQVTYANHFMLIVSNVNLTYKISAEDVLVWAVDTRTGKPVSQAPLAVYNEKGNLIASGQTDAEGIFTSSLADTITPYESSTVLLGQPGRAVFCGDIRLEHGC